MLICKSDLYETLLLAYFPLGVRILANDSLPDVQGTLSVNTVQLSISSFSLRPSLRDAARMRPWR
ncbi:hypothetical protein [Nostoc sp.]|uniref:hypothetical protein n=1 Tax=Nostoc sp. TaxID=1180 RepID=UPI002FF87E24